MQKTSYNEVATLSDNTKTTLTTLTELLNFVVKLLLQSQHAEDGRRSKVCLERAVFNY